MRGFKPTHLLGFSALLILLAGCQATTPKIANYQGYPTSFTSPLMATPQRGSLNFMIPDDVMRAYESAPSQTKLEFCSSRGGNIAQTDVQNALRRPVPDKIEGYNSRMDNGASVPYSDEVGLITLRMSELITDAKTTQDVAKQNLALDFLSYWATNDALLKTKSCVVDGQWVMDCPAWTRPDGQDLSVSMDWSTTQMWVMKLAYGYYFGLAGFKPEDPRHDPIQTWFKKFITRNKTADKVYYGLDHGWFWPAILKRMIEGKDARDLAEKLVASINQQVLPDGSMKDRTTRGNRALWYHHSALSETLVSLEIARVFGVPMPSGLENRIEKAGDIFINAINDPSTLDPWASKAHNSVFRPGEQQFEFDLERIPNAHSWWYIFAYRYPDSPVTQKLELKLNSIRPQTQKDGMIGFGLGCYYAAASSE